MMNNFQSIESDNFNKLTIFYDGECPLCSEEMKQLKKHDDNSDIVLINLHQDDFSIHFPQVDKTKAMKILHGYYQNKLLLGLEVTHRAWTLVGRGMYVAPLEWPIIKQLSHAVYLIVAKYRQPISNFLHKRFGIGSTDCDKGVCYGKSNNTNTRSK